MYSNSSSIALDAMDALFGLLSYTQHYDPIKIKNILSCWNIKYDIIKRITYLYYELML